MVKSSEEYAKTGNEIIKFLGLKLKHNKEWSEPRVATEWGTKSPEGLARSLERIIKGEG